MSISIYSNEFVRYYMDRETDKVSYRPDVQWQPKIKWENEGYYKKRITKTLKIETAHVYKFRLSLIVE